jgi:hypothetical protein
MYAVTVHLVEGEPLRFTVELPEWRLLGLGDDIDKAQSRTVISVELDGKLLMVPYSSIRYIEVDPAPPELPKYLLRGARSL